MCQTCMQDCNLYSVLMGWFLFWPMSGIDKFHEDCCCGEFQVFLLRASLVTFSRFYTQSSRIPTVTGTIPVAFVLQEFFSMHAA